MEHGQVVGEEGSPAVPGKRRRKWYWIAVAAGLAIVAGVTVAIIALTPDEEDDVRAAVVAWTQAWADRDSGRICRAMVADMAETCADAMKPALARLTDEQADRMRGIAVERVELFERDGHRLARAYLSPDAEVMNPGRMLRLAYENGRWAIEGG